MLQLFVAIYSGDCSWREAENGIWLKAVIHSE